MRPLLTAALAITLGSLVLAPFFAKATAGEQDGGDRKPIKDSQLRVEAEIQKLQDKLAALRKNRRI